MNPVGQNVKDRRIKKGLSQNQLAKKAGISQASLNALEAKTNNPSVETCFLLAAALDCTVSELLGETAEQLTALSPRQRELLDIFDQLNDAGQDSLLALGGNLLAQQAFRKERAIR